MPDSVIAQIKQKHQVDQTFTGGGHPHTFVELFGGQMVQMLDVEPDILTFRDKYYYNSAHNILYIKKLDWVNIDRQFDSEDSSYVYYNGRPIKKTVDEPDVEDFGDKYYYSLISKRVFGKASKWVKCTNL